jgi:hypothetical protein
MTQQLAFKTLDDTIETTPEFIACTRCGIEIPHNTIAKRVSRGNTDGRCRDCVATESGKGTNARSSDQCSPWLGEIDLDTLQPLKANGEPHMPGVRVCGHADCCNRSHVVPNA